MWGQLGIFPRVCETSSESGLSMEQVVVLLALVLVLVMLLVLLLVLVAWSRHA